MNEHEPNKAPAPEIQPEPSIIEPPRRSPWSFKAKAVRSLWGITQIILFRSIPTPLHGVRRAVLRGFGANIGRNVQIHPSVRVIIPWNITIDDNVIIHERAILYALGEISIGSGSEIGPHTHLCAGTHDYSDPKFTLLRQPITLGPRCVLGAGSFVAPNVTLAQGTVLAPRAAVYADTEPEALYIGNPAKRAETTS